MQCTLYIRIARMTIHKHQHMQPVIFHRYLSIFGGNNIDTCNQRTAVCRDEINDKVFKQVNRFHKTQNKILKPHGKMVIIYLQTVVQFFDKAFVEFFGIFLCASLQKSRSEEHTSELQSRQYLVCRLL